MSRNPGLYGATRGRTPAARPDTKLVRRGERSGRQASDFFARLEDFRRVLRHACKTDASVYSDPEFEMKLTGRYSGEGGFTL